MSDTDPKTDSNQESSACPALNAINSKELLQGKREVQIQHLGNTYRLLLTRNGKLILQK